MGAVDAAAAPITPSGTETVRIPKHLRQEWCDLLCLDPAVTDIEFRVAHVIGVHFNKTSGETFVSQETIAALVGRCDRTVWSAIQALEAKGYLIVTRRELARRDITLPTGGVRERVYYGGRGTANVYQPAFERRRLAGSGAARKLAARCDQYWRERSQKRTSKIAHRYDPTLSSSSKNNPISHSADAVTKPSSEAGKRHPAADEAELVEHRTKAEPEIRTTEGRKRFGIEDREWWVRLSLLAEAGSRKVRVMFENAREGTGIMVDAVEAASLSNLADRFVKIGAGMPGYDVWIEWYRKLGAFLPRDRFNEIWVPTPSHPETGPSPR